MNFITEILNWYFYPQVIKAYLERTRIWLATGHLPVFIRTPPLQRFIPILGYFEDIALASSSKFSRFTTGIFYDNQIYRLKRRQRFQQLAEQSV